MSAQHQVVIVPGLHNSGSAHWQTWLEQKHPAYRRVRQRDWDAPCLDEWTDNLEDLIRESSEPVVIVAHSFGCLVAARLASRGKLPIRGALLVAPASPAKFDVVDSVPNFRLPFRSIVVASWNDPWLSFTRACFWAATWGGRLIDLGRAGHINAESGFGAWPLAERLIQGLAEKEVSRAIPSRTSLYAASVSY